MKKPLKKSTRTRPMSQGRTVGWMRTKAQDDNFLAVQTARLLDLFPDNTLKPAHRQGLSLILKIIYYECIVLQLIRSIPADRAAHIARTYVEQLRPRSFKDFSKVTTRVVRVNPTAVLAFPNLYFGILPMVQSTFRKINDLDLGSAGYSDQAIAAQYAESLLSQFPPMPTLSQRLPSFVNADLFLNQRGIVKPHHAARLLSARILGLGDKSQVQLERYHKAAYQTLSSVRDWESPEAKALAEQIFPLPS